MNKVKYYLGLCLLATTVVFSSCDNDDEEDDFEVLPFAEVRGDFQGSEICDGDTVGPYHMLIYNTSDNQQVWVDGIWDYAPIVKANVSGNTFTIPAQQVIHRGSTPATNDTFNIVSATGTVNDGNLTFDFVLDYHGTPVNCQYKGVKQ